MQLIFKFNGMTDEESLLFLQALQEMKGTANREAGLDTVVKSMSDKMSQGLRAADVAVRWHNSSSHPGKIGEEDMLVGAEKLQDFWNLLGIFPERNHPAYAEIIKGVERIATSELCFQSEDQERGAMSVLSELIDTLKRLPSPPVPWPLDDCLASLCKKVKENTTWGSKMKKVVVELRDEMRERWGLV